MYPREEFITAGVRETAQGGEYPTVKSKDDDASRGDIFKHTIWERMTLSPILSLGYSKTCFCALFLA
jgi:hypothetical protein